MVFPFRSLFSSLDFRASLIWPFVPVFRVIKIVSLSAFWGYSGPNLVEFWDCWAFDFRARVSVFPFVYILVLV